MLNQLFKEKRWHTLYLEMSKNIENPEIDTIFKDLLMLTSKLYPVELVMIFILYTNKLDNTQSILLLDQAISNIKTTPLYGVEHKEAELFMRLHKLLFELKVRNIEEDIYEIMNNEFVKDEFVKTNNFNDISFNNKNSFTSNIKKSKMSERCFFVFNILCRKYFESIGDYATALTYSRDEFSILRNALLADNVYNFESIYLNSRMDDFRNLKIDNKLEIRKLMLGIDVMDKKTYNPNNIWDNTKHLVNIYFDNTDCDIYINDLRKVYDLVRVGDYEEIQKIDIPLPKDIIFRKAMIVRILKMANNNRKIDLNMLGLDINIALDYALDLLGSGIIIGFINERVLHIDAINENILSVSEIKQKFGVFNDKIQKTLDLCGIN
ncbi:hypothetical protein DMUE_1181 [Dictyocoela muelleri]|nr:hypothetical protein DMUE_1181 [Dictyocoela muelleri]